MPIYEYNCQECGAHFEALRAMKDADAPIVCPECGCDHVKRGLSTFFATSSSGPIKGASAGGACSSCSASSCAGCSSNH